MTSVERAVAENRHVQAKKSDAQKKARTDAITALEKTFQKSGKIVTEEDKAACLVSTTIDRAPSTLIMYKSKAPMDPGAMDVDGAGPW